MHLGRCTEMEYGPCKAVLYLRCNTKEHFVLFYRDYLLICDNEFLSNFILPSVFPIFITLNNVPLMNTNTAGKRRPMYYIVFN